MLADLITKLDEGDLVLVLILVIVAAVLIVKSLAVMFVDLVHGHESDDVEIDRQTDALRAEFDGQTRELTLQLSAIVTALHAIGSDTTEIAERGREIAAPDPGLRRAIRKLRDRDEAYAPIDRLDDGLANLYEQAGDEIDGADEAIDLTKSDAPRPYRPTDLR